MLKLIKAISLRPRFMCCASAPRYHSYTVCEYQHLKCKEHLKCHPNYNAYINNRTHLSQKSLLSAPIQKFNCI